MLPIFTDVYNARRSVSKAPTADWLKLRVADSVKNLITHHHRTIHAVRSDHPLVQVLKHIGSMQDTPLDLYYHADLRAPYLSRNLGFTTDYNKGTFKGHKLYSTEDNYIYSTGNYIRPFEAVTNWRTLKPLKSLWLDSNYMDLAIPSDKTDRKGLGAVALDIPVMSLMYKGFLEEQKKLGTHYGEEAFVGTYVLPSILESQVDSTCISAVMAIFYGTYESRNRVDSNYYVQAYGPEFEKVAKHALNAITDTRMPYVQTMHHLPSIFVDSGLQAMILPDYPSTIQVDWAMFASRVKIINFLLDVGGKQGRNANQGFINDLKSYMRDIKSNQIPYNNMSDTLATVIDKSLERYSKL